MKARGRSFLLTEEHAGVLAGGIVHRYQQVPPLIAHPAAGAGILVQHHAHKGSPFALAAVFAPAFGALDPAGALQHRLEPAIVARARIVGFALGMEMRRVPARKTAVVHLHDPVNSHPAGAALRYLTQPLVQQSVQTIGLVTLNVAPKAALALPKTPGRLAQCQSSLCSAITRLFEFHLPVPPHVAGPAYGGV